MTNEVSHTNALHGFRLQVRNDQTVDARELHTFLQVGKDFSTWLKDRIKKYGFKAGVDFAEVDSPKLCDNPGRGGDRRSREFSLSLDMAKELSMVERNARGKQARQYFIDCERLARQAAAKPRQPDGCWIPLDDPLALRQALLGHSEIPSEQAAVNA